MVKIDSRIEVVDLVAELLKLVKGKEAPSDPITNYANYVHSKTQFADFSLNVLFVSQICSGGAYTFSFNKFRCFLQDQSTEQIEYSLPTPAVDNDDNHIELLHSLPTVSSPSYDVSPEITPPVLQTDDATSSPQPPRRSSRVSHKPLRLNGFVCQHNSSILHANFATYSSFVTSISAIKEPRSFTEVVQSPEWRATMDAEIEVLEMNHTWKLSPLPAGKRAIGCKWVFKVKLWADGSVEQYKSPLVAKGYNQVEGIDYTESFTPIAKAVTDIYMVPPAAYKVASGLTLERHAILGLEIARNADGIYLAQMKYVMDIVADTGLLQAKAVSTPFPSGLKLSLRSGVLLSTPDSYKCLATLHVVKYLRGCCPTLGLFLPATSLNLQCYCDADWASCSDSRHSLTGFCVFLADFGVNISLSISLYYDNKVVVHILANPIFHERTKHIEIDCHLVRDVYKDGFVAPVLVRSFAQIADIFTKALTLQLFRSFISKLGCVSFAPSPTCGEAVGFSSAAIGPCSDAAILLPAAGTKADLLDQG
ncbi:uncharacterized protein LOC110011585 [Sesamum indicum]|uniref:Uncharacterized protein LOC110011585 n=1 Tax=Sesamum indicum TaxID=4182 RepID=A0A8M8UUU5_SESIN|nr:uncharacterized protein LOC110011585 [Sesamum indicum]